MGIYGIVVLCFFLEQYFGNFDVNVWYCSIIQPCGVWFFNLLAKKIVEDVVVVFICPRLPNAGQYFQDFRLTGK